MAKYFYSALIPILLSACLPGPDYEPPQMPLPESFHQSINTDELDSAEKELQAWWLYFNDPVLDLLVFNAQRKNNDILAAMERVNQSRALAGEARLGLLPDSKLVGDYTEGVFGTARNPFIGDLDRDYRAFSVGAETNWEIDLFGRVRRIIEQREASAEAMEDALAAVIVSVQSEVVSSYIELRSAQEELIVLKENSDTQKQSVDLTRAIFESGSSSELDLARAESQYFRTRSSIPQVIAKKEASLHRIAVLLGTTVDTLPEELFKHSKIPTYKGPVAVSNPQALISERPDIRQAERELASQTANIGVETADLLPRINFVGNIGVQAPNFSDLDGEDRDFYAYGPSISWKILSFRRVLRRIEAADAAAKQSLYNYQQTTLKALEEVENALANFRTERTRYNRLKRAVDASRKAADISRQQHEAGSLDFLDVLAADRTKLELEYSLKQSQAEVQKSYSNLYRALGGGWKFSELQEEQKES